jgi:hypothetical protein
MLGKWEPNDIKVDDILKASLLALEVGALEPRSQILGGVVIFDLIGLSLQHAFNTTPNVVSKVIQIMVVRKKLNIGYYFGNFVIYIYCHNQELKSTNRHSLSQLLYL